MYFASHSGYIEVVKILLASGADVRIENKVSIIYNMLIFCDVLIMNMIIIRMDIHHCILLLILVVLKL